MVCLEYTLFRPFLHHFPETAFSSNVSKYHVVLSCCPNWPVSYFGLLSRFFTHSPYLEATCHETLLFLLLSSFPAFLRPIHEVMLGAQRSIPAPALSALHGSFPISLMAVNTIVMAVTPCLYFRLSLPERQSPHLTNWLFYTSTCISTCQRNEKRKRKCFHSSVHGSCVFQSLLRPKTLQPLITSPFLS